MVLSIFLSIPGFILMQRHGELPWTHPIESSTPRFIKTNKRETDFFERDLDITIENRA